MYDKKGFKGNPKQTRKSRRQQEWELAQRKEQARKNGDKKEARRLKRQLEDDERDWRDILMDEGDERYSNI
ncbi:MAG: hypothetical protein AB1690_09965 [Candidatus Zixiibacteriota bacterium]|jgi:hypothetical protein